MHMHVTQEGSEESVLEQIKRDWHEAAERPSPFPQRHGFQYGAEEVCPDCRREQEKRTCPCCGKRFHPPKAWMTRSVN